MKGISSVMATVLLLVITLALVSVAYGFIQGLFTSRTAIVLGLSESTTCSVTTITVYVRNDGIQTTTADKLTISGTRADGTAITSVACGAATTTIGSGTETACTNTVTGTRGSNRIVVSGAGSSARGTVYCVG